MVRSLFRARQHTLEDIGHKKYFCGHCSPLLFQFLVNLLTHKNCDLSGCNRVKVTTVVKYTGHLKH